ncbi:MAG: alanine racemase [Anaerolineaceae bacterium]|nr:alanine racemase [Anaerolineaceae bacterium]
MQQQVVAEINLAALRANYKTLATLAGGAQVIAPVKDNAYGHGAVEVSRCLVEAGAAMLAVVTLNEALELRDAGLAAPVLVMGVIDPKRVGEAIQENIAVAVHGMEHGLACQREARAAGGRLVCHLHADTGMHRLGTAYDDVVRLVERLSGSEHVRLEALMAHHSHAEDPEASVTEAQIRRLEALVADLERRGLRPPIVHAANSATVMRFPQGMFDMVRPGISLYGITPCPEQTRQVDLQPVLSLHAPIALIKDIQAGQGVSYGHTWRAERTSRIAALPVGYGDGYRRALSNRASVRVEGQLAPVVGNICMDTTLIDVTGIAGARVGSRATLIEAAGDSPLSVYALANMLGTIPHEIVCSLGQRVRRVFIGGEGCKESS